MSALLQANLREDTTKKSVITNIRKQGGFPAIVYGKDKPNKAISIDALDFMKVIKDVGKNGVIQLKVDTEQDAVMLYDIQTDPLKGEVVHADFYRVDMSTEVDAEVAVHLTGEAQGVKDGGILQHPLHQVSIKSLPGDIPEQIDVDVSALEVGDSIYVKDLKGNNKYEIQDDDDTVIVSILPPITDAELESGEVQDSGDEQAQETGDQGEEDKSEE